MAGLFFVWIIRAIFRGEFNVFGEKMRQEVREEIKEGHEAINKQLEEMRGAIKDHDEDIAHVLAKQSVFDTRLDALEKKRTR